MIRCPNCGAAQPGDAKTCSNCGAALTPKRTDRPATPQLTPKEIADLSRHALRYTALPLIVVFLSLCIGYFICTSLIR